MSKYIRIESPLSVSSFFATQPGAHSFVENQHRPAVNTSLYNGTDEDIVITIPAKTVAYLPGQFAQDKYGQVTHKITAKTLSITQPLGINQPFAKSAKPKS